MQRNLDRRVELIAPIEDPDLKRHLKEDILNVCWQDNVKARRLLPDGSYERVRAADGEPRIDAQNHFINFYTSQS